MLGGDQDILNATGFCNNEDINKIIQNAVKNEHDRTMKAMYSRIIIGGLLIAFILAIVWRGADASTDVLNQLSLASSITSIFLAFVAIIYAFYQSKVATEQATQMQTYLKTIGDQVNALGSISNEIAQFRINFEQRMDAVKALQDVFTQGQEEFSKSINSVSSMINEMPVSKEIINRVNEALDQLKSTSEQQNTKVAENIDNIVSHSIPSTVLLPGRINLRRITSKSISVTLSLDNNESAAVIGKNISEDIEQRLKEKLKVPVEVKATIQQLVKGAVVKLILTVTVFDKKFYKNDFESLILEVLQDQYTILESIFLQSVYHKNN